MKKLITSIGAFALLNVIAPLAFTVATPVAASACNLSGCDVVEVRCLGGTTDVVLWSQKNLACRSSSASVQQAPHHVRPPVKTAAIVQPPRVKTVKYAPAPVKTLPTVKVSAPANSGGGSKCDARDAIPLGNDITWTFDHQSNTCGYNMKMKGSKTPVRFKVSPGANCTGRMDGVGGTFACKFNIPRNNVYQIDGGVRVIGTFMGRPLTFDVRNGYATRVN